MNQEKQRTQVMPWTLVGLTAVLLGAAALMPDEDWPLEAIVLIGIALLFASVCGALVASRTGGNVIGWILIGVGLCLTSGLAATQYANRALVERPGSLPGGLYAGWLQSWLFVPLFALFPLLVLLFPTGRVIGPRWRLVGWCVVAATAGFVVRAMFRPGPFETFPRVRNPLGVEGIGSMSRVIAGPHTVLMIAVALACIASAVVRYRRAVGDERRQLKAFVFGTVVAVPLAIAGPLLAIAGVPNDLLPGSVELGLIFPVIAFITLPAAITLAILRFHLYDIDRLVSRTLAYTLVTFFLGGLFALVVLVPPAVIGSRGTTPDWLVAIATLVVAALFRPVRWRVQNAIDHRFNRRRYDAARTIDEFTARMREQTEIEALRIDLESLVQRTMQPAHVSVWLRTGLHEAEVLKVDP